VAANLCNDAAPAARNSGQETAMKPTTQAVPIHGLHHFAYRCRDAEETRSFYEDILGLPLTHIIRAEIVPSTGEYCPYVHIFFEMGDGSFLAFFDLGDNIKAAPSPNTPAWVNHIALRVDDVAKLEQMKVRLQEAGVEVLGITDHEIIKSIYFFDPNGIRLELTTEIATKQEMDEAKLTAHAQLASWSTEKRQRVGA
jgi:glyoxylase I family protein